MKFKDLYKKFENLEIEVDEDKLDMIVKFLTHCAIKGILKNKSPQFTYLIRESMEFSRKEAKDG